MFNVVDFVADTNEIRRFAIDDLLFVEYRCLVEETPSRYWSHKNYFAFVTGGKKKWVTPKAEYMVHDGEAIFIRRGAYLSHNYYDEDFCALFIFIPDDFIKDVLLKMQTHPTSFQEVEPDGIIRVDLDEALKGYLHSMFSYFGREREIPRDLLKLKFEELIMNVLINPKNRELQHYFNDLAKTTKIRIPEIMERNYPSRLSIAQFARMSGRSISTFKRDFFKIYGETPGKWLIRKRVHHARLLLENTALSINEVAVQSGFENTSHFIRVFKQCFGSPPQRYRHNLLVNISG